MNIFENLKLNKWYGIILYLGVLIIAASLLFKVDFLEEKHTFGFGLGLIMIGLSYFMAEKVANQFAYGGILSWQIIKHNPVSVIILTIGIALTVGFGFLIVRGLI